MNRDKQIEEMGKIVETAHSTNLEGCEKDSNYGDRIFCLGCDHFDKETCLHTLYVGESLYNAGYRKASEVAREIFDEIETSLVIGSAIGSEVYYAIRAEDYLHYKKKYTEGEG